MGHRDKKELQQQHCLRFMTYSGAVLHTLFVFFHHSCGCGSGLKRSGYSL